MTIKNVLDKWIPSLSESLKQQYAAGEIEEIKNLSADLLTNADKLMTCNNDVNGLKEMNTGLIEDSDKYEKTVRQLVEQVRILTKKPVNIPSANITYQRPFLVGKNEWKYTMVDVRMFIMPDFIIEEETKAHYYDSSQDLDTLIPIIYNMAKSNYKYGSDTKFGFSELWLFPFESRAARAYNLGIDCDDYMNMIGSYFAAANIPRDKWLLSCGKTRSNIGHATVYAKDSTGAWRHMNSTYTKDKPNNLQDFPHNKDLMDSAGIAEDKFWFSYNDYFSLHKFESTEAEKSFNDELGRKMNIN